MNKDIEEFVYVGLLYVLKWDYGIYIVIVVKDV